MNRVFVDTSALFALVAVGDVSHEKAARAFDRVRGKNAVLLTTSYNLLETYAIIDRRLGREAVLTFRAHMAPLVDVSWVDEELHHQGLDAMVERGKSVSLVDAVSFVFIRRNRIDAVFAFDRHFADEGFPMLD